MAKTKKTKTTAAPPPGSERGMYEDNEDPITKLIALQTLRKHCIRSQSRSDRGVEALIAGSMGYYTGLPEPDRKKIFKLAQATRLGIEEWMRTDNWPEDHGRVPAGIIKAVRISFSARQEWDLFRADIEISMMNTARSLPIWPWVRDVRGVAELGLAVIVAEAGDLSNYSGPGRLWKRLGLACMDGQRQGIVPKEVTGDARKEAWKLRGYNPARRAEIWAFLDDVMFRSQWRGPKEDKPGYAIGPYGQVYADRKEWNLARGLVPAHADRDARRFMSKRFLRDLWNAWQMTDVRALEVAAQ